MLFVGIPPSITTQPQSQTTVNGSNAVFTVSAAGQTPLSYQRWKNGATLIDSGRIAGSTSSALTIAASSFADAGSYRVVATNQFGAASSSPASLAVVSPPTISGIPNQRLFPNGASRTVAFSVSDPQSSALIVSTVSSNIAAVPNANIVLGGGGSNRTITVASAGKGTSTITVNVQNAYGLTASANFDVTVADFSPLSQSLAVRWDGAVKWVDYDNDGRLDLFISGNDTNSGAQTTLYHNDGNGQFSLVPTQFPNVGYGSADWGDFDNDGLADLVISGETARGSIGLQVYRNLGNGQFAWLTTLASDYYFHVAWGDYNNDGKPDILAIGRYGTQIFRNNGDGTFTATVTNLSGGDFSGGSWIDVDGDGLLDAFVFSIGNTAVYRNTGNDFFANTGISLPLCQFGFGALADFNNDGRPDLLMSGAASGGGGQARVFVNTGGSLVDLGLSLPSYQNSAGAWGDFDNDGNIDFLLTGDYSDAGPLSLFHNDGRTNFVDRTLNLPGVGLGAIAAGDFDNDGVLDFAVMGLGYGGWGMATIYHNDGAMPNTPPTAPSGLTAIASNNAVILSWNAATDAEQTGGLSYNLRMGSSAGNVNVVAPMADSNTGWRRVPQIGNAGYLLTKTITNLANGTYYWSVQAIDNAFAGSQFAAEQSFQIVASPVITAQPQNQTVVVSNAASFSVSANGSLPLRYQWYHNGTLYADTLLTNARSNGLTIVKVSATDAGTYTAVVSNAFGTATSAVATLTVLFPPVINPPLPPNVTLGAGTSTQITAIVNGTPAITNQWFFNGAPFVTNNRVYVLDFVVSSASYSALTLNNLQGSDAGTYTVVSSNVVGSTSSTSILTVGFPPSINPQPQSTTVVIGGSTSLSVGTDGTVPFTYQWYRNGTQLSDGAQITGVHTSALSISNASAAQVGTYVVVVANGFGTVTSSAATVTLSFPPLLSGLSNVVAPVGSNATFTAIISGTKPVTNQWFYNGAPVVPSDRISIQEGLVSTNSYSSLTISNAQVSDSGSYSIVSANIAGSATNSATTLVVGYPPAITNQPQSQTVQVYSPIALTVAATGDLPISYQWYHGATALTDNAQFTGTHTATLSIASADSFTPGSYFAVLTNLFGAATSAVATVTVLQPPFFSTPTNETIGVGTNTNFTIVIGGTQPMTNQWFFNGSPLATNSRIDAVENASSNGVVSALYINNVQASDAGSYWLVSSNVAGSGTSSTATLTVGFPPTITQQPLAQTSIENASPNFTVGATGSNPLSYQWYFGANALIDSQRISGSTTPSLTLSNVVPVDSGSYSVVVSNAFGSTTSSAASLTVWIPPTISTQPIGRSVPLGLPTLFAGSTGSGSSPLSYQWRLNGANIPGATTIAYTISAVGAADLGSYALVVSNVAGTVTSSNALLTLGPIVGWGDNYYNQCLAPPGLSNVVSPIAYGDSFAVLSDGSVVKWGSSPAANPSSLSNVVALAASGENCVALRSDGIVVGLGVSIPTTWTNITAIAAGSSYWYALRSDGTVLGTDQRVPAGLTKVTAISASGTQGMALRSDGTVVVWPITSLGATNVPAGLTNVISIASGYSYCLAAKSDGHVVVWQNYRPIAGVTNVPTSATNIIAVAASDGSSGTGPQSIALRSDGKIITWGAAAPSSTNVVDPSAISNAVAVSQGLGYGLALVNDGSPQLIRPPIGGTAYSGNNFTLSAQAAGTPVLSYQWSFNGTNIDGVSNNVYTITNIQAANAGTYQLIVTNSFGSVTSVPVPVNVVDSAPFFSLQPASRTVYVGANVNLGVPINGSGPLSVQWMRAAGQGYVNIPGATNQDLIFDPVTVNNSGTYAVLATNSFGAVYRDNIILNVRQVVAWGDNTYGKTNVPTTLTNAIAVCGGDYYNMFALRANGTVASWGSTTTNYTGVSNVIEIASPTSTTGTPYIALKQDGSVVALTSSPSLRNALTNLTNIVAIEADTSGSTYLRPDGTIARFNSSGTPITTFVSNVVALSTFDDGYIALRVDSVPFLTLYYSGTGTAPNVKTATNVQAIASARYQGTLLNRNGTVQSWSNTNAPAGSNFIAIAASSLTSAAVDAAGNVFTWSSSANDLALTSVPAGLSRVWSLDGGYRGFVAICSTNNFSPLPLSDSLNTSNLVVSSRNSAQWFGQTNISHDGSSAAQSAQIDSNTASSMRMLVTNGPINVRFWWKVSSLTNHSLLTFSVGGVPQTSISGEVDWQQVSFTVPAGPQMLVWTYSKDAAGTSGLDAGFVDQLSFDSIAPTLLTQPASQTIIGGPAITFNASAYGTGPLGYRWFNRVSGTPVANTSSFNISPTYRSSSGTYYVIVTNNAGTARSSNFVLTVHVPQLIGTPQLQPDGTFLISSQDADQNPFNGNTDLSGLQAQYSSNLIDWWPVLAPLSISNGAVLFSDSDATNAPARFYRIVEGW